MRKLLIVLLVASLFTGVYADGFFTPDKIDHFFTAAAITVSCALAVIVLSPLNGTAANISMAIALPLIMSVAKEVYDGVSKTGEVSYKDLIYDLLGIAAGILITR